VGKEIFVGFSTQNIPNFLDFIKSILIAIGNTINVLQRRMAAVHI
jgi:hypothetical protein